MRLPKDRVVIVTGASGGIGRETALAFARDGARVVLAARSREKLEALAKEIGSHALAVPADVTKRDDLRALVAAAESKFGAVHVLVNNAGRGHYAPLERTTDEDFDAVMRLNVYAPFMAAREVLPVMKRQRCGQIINISSAVGRMAIPLMPAYSASKWALEGLSDALRIELRPHGIDVIVVGPGLTATNFQSNSLLGGFTESPAYDNSQGVSPARVARAILSASRWRRRRVSVGMDAKTGVFFNWLLPRTMDLGLSIWMKQTLAKHPPR